MAGFARQLFKNLPARLVGMPTHGRANLAQARGPDRLLQRRQTLQTLGNGALGKAQATLGPVQQQPGRGLPMQEFRQQQRHPD